MELRFEIDKTPDLESLADLFEQSGFNRLGERAADRLPTFLKNSSSFVCAYSVGELVGFVRLFTDWVSRGFLCDLCVFPSQRGKGIGAALMSKMLTLCDNKGLPVVNFSDFRSHGFYSKLGFKVEDSFNFMYRVNPKIVR